jgi:saccharopine dehydrogenase (NADP+, L-glutamate forming)
MKQIVIIGAGRSASSLIQYLINYAKNNPVSLVVADTSLELARQKIAGAGERVSAISLDIFKQEELSATVAGADVVISMVPARFHTVVAEACIRHKKYMISASYASAEIQALHAQAEAAGILILKECGLDPGIDHMTAMEALNAIRKRGGKIKSFKSYTGGLIAPESDTNPWRYKFTWNPRNVVLAGQGANQPGVARYLENGEVKYIPYHQLFTRSDQMEVPPYGNFEGYANRDSLSYRQVYGLNDIPTIIRGTLRVPPYSIAWHQLLTLGMTDDSYQMEGVANMRWRDYTNAFLPYDTQLSVEEKAARLLKLDPEGKIFSMLKWLGLFSEQAVGLTEGSPAQVLQHLLEQKWSLSADDKDMVVMQHIFEWEEKGENKRMYSSLVSLGDDQVHTAMAKTVGWPLAIAAKLILEGKISRKGVCLPVTEDIYQPILQELKVLGIEFQERIEKI